MKDYHIEPANDHDFCLLCQGKADKKLVGRERTFRFCEKCGVAFAKQLYEAFGVSDAAEELALVYQILGVPEEEEDDF